MQTQTATLRDIIERAKKEHGRPLSDLTVLAAQRDPYRLDTPANHGLGAWLRDAYEQVSPAGRLHLRALHYAFVGRVKLPDGSLYTNTDETWLFLSQKAAKAARYLGYLDWHLIRDARNSPPRVFTPEYEPPAWTLRTAEVEVYLPEDLSPSFVIAGDMYRQPYRQVVIAEKQGVESLLLPVCQELGATLALPAGEISDTMVFELLDAANDDGRPLVVHQLGDCDPAGHQMAVSTSRTIQALCDTQFPDLEVLVFAPALTVGQCTEWDLPSTPLKETEQRADRWLAAMGREQTELDAAVALAPEAFAEVVRNSLLQFYDTDLKARADRLRAELEGEANEGLVERLGAQQLTAMLAEAEEKLGEMDDLVAQINDSLRIDPDQVGIEAPEDPDVLVGETACSTEPLIDTAGDWAEQTRRLVNRKAY